MVAAENYRTVCWQLVLQAAMYKAPFCTLGEVNNFLPNLQANMNQGIIVRRHCLMNYASCALCRVAMAMVLLNEVEQGKNWHIKEAACWALRCSSLGNFLLIAWLIAVAGLCLKAN